MKQDVVKLHDLLNQSIESLDEASNLIISSGIAEPKEAFILLGTAIGEILQVQKWVYEIAPELDTKEAEAPDSNPTTEEEFEIEKLDDYQRNEIDAVLLSCTSHEFRKVSRVVGSAMLQLKSRFPEIPDIFYSLRIQHLVSNGLLVSQGNLKFMRYSEIRIS
jgi:Protein of unknown function